MIVGPVAESTARAVLELDPTMWGDLGPHLTCTEAETVAAFLRAWGNPGAADLLIEGHAAEDLDGDDHYRETS